MFVEAIRVHRRGNAFEMKMRVLMIIIFVCMSLRSNAPFESPQNVNGTRQRNEEGRTIHEERELVRVTEDETHRKYRERC
jgi:hypothetical protein